MELDLPYGDRLLRLAIDDARVVGVAGAELSPWGDRVEQRVDELLDDPLGFPRLERAIVPGDHVAVVVGPDACGMPLRAMVQPVVERLIGARVEPRDIVLLGSQPSPGALDPAELDHWAAQLDPPPSVRLHDATDRNTTGYLASTTDGQRIYLDRTVVDADMVVLVGRTDFDPIAGYAGAHSTLWPGLSDTDSIRRHLKGLDVSSPAWAEPDSQSRRHVEEIGWLLGTQFAVHAVTDGRGMPLDLLVGEAKAVTAAAVTALDQRMRPSLDRPADLVICCVPRPTGHDTLGAMAGALAKATRWVRPGGHVVLVGPCSAGDGLGLARQWLHDADTPAMLLKALRSHPAPEAATVGPLAAAALHAHLYLVSELPGPGVEDLFITPLDDVRALARLVTRHESCAVIMDGAAVLPDCPPRVP